MTGRLLGPREIGTTVRYAPDDVRLRHTATCDQNRTEGGESGAIAGPGSSQMAHDVRRGEFTSLVDPDAPVPQRGMDDARRGRDPGRPRPADAAVVAARTWCSGSPRSPRTSVT